jgi:hypothetical protein
MMTLEILEAMEPHSVIATGTADNIYNTPIRWVAKRGFIHDWAIYYGEESQTVEQIKSYGSKVRAESIIQRLVPCDDAMLKMYRQ